MANNKLIKEQRLSYKQLNEIHNEMNDYLQDLISFEKSATNELKYLKDFIHYKNLDSEFAYFCEHATEDTESDLPFPYLILK